MTTFLLRRTALIVPTLFFVSILIFGLQQLLPGDPALAGKRTLTPGTDLPSTNAPHGGSPLE